MKNVLPVNKALLIFTDKYGRLLDTYNLEHAYHNLLNQLSILDNTAVIFDDYSQYLIGDQYIFGYNRLPIYVSRKYENNIDWAVNLKSKDILNQYINTHNVNFVYLHLTSYTMDYDFDKSDVIIEIRCRFLGESNNGPSIDSLFPNHHADHKAKTIDTLDENMCVLYYWYSGDLIKSLIDCIDITFNKCTQDFALKNIAHTIPVSIPKLPWYFPNDGDIDPELHFESILVKNKYHRQSIIKRGLVTEITIFDESLW